jgi:hypothetical protein
MFRWHRPPSARCTDGGRARTPCPTPPRSHGGDAFVDERAQLELGAAGLRSLVALLLLPKILLVLGELPASTTIVE